jgi:hypothetical protein
MKMKTARSAPARKIRCGCGPADGKLSTETRLSYIARSGVLPVHISRYTATLLPVLSAFGTRPPAEGSRTSLADRDIHDSVRLWRPQKTPLPQNTSPSTELAGVLGQEGG